MGQNMLNEFFLRDSTCKLCWNIGQFENYISMKFLKDGWSHCFLLWSKVFFKNFCGGCDRQWKFPYRIFIFFHWLNFFYINSNVSSMDLSMVVVHPSLMFLLVSSDCSNINTITNQLIFWQLSGNRCLHQFALPKLSLIRRIACWN